MTDERIAIISDIHGNLQALEAVIADIERRGIKKIYCAGDIVGYGAQPNECIRVVKSKLITCMMGNHDEAAINEDMNIDHYRATAKKAVNWTRKKLTDKSRDFLRELTYLMNLPHFQLVHSEPGNPREFDYINNEVQAEIASSEMSSTLCFYGHSHTAEFYIIKDGLAKRMDPGQFTFREDAKLLVNVGSVGQPRAKHGNETPMKDRDPRACYVIFTPGKIEYVKVDYNIKLAQKHILDAGLPKFLAERLALGI